MILSYIFAGMDFSNDSHSVTINHDTNYVNLKIVIMQDGISENNEVFLLFLRDVTKPTEDNEMIPVRFGRAVTIAHIVQPRKCSGNLRCWTSLQVNLYIRLWFNL